MRKKSGISIFSVSIVLVPERCLKARSGNGAARLLICYTNACLLKGLGIVCVVRLRTSTAIKNGGNSVPAIFRIIPLLS